MEKKGKGGKTKRYIGGTSALGSWRAESPIGRTGKVPLRYPNNFLLCNTIHLQVSLPNFFSFFLTLLTSHLHQPHLSSSFHRFTHLSGGSSQSRPFNQSPSFPCPRYVGSTAVAAKPLCFWSHHIKAPQRPIRLVVIKSLIRSPSTLDDHLSSPCPTSSLRKDTSRALPKGKQSPSTQHSILPALLAPTIEDAKAQISQLPCALRPWKL